MSFQRFIIKNVFRNKRRTALTVLSIGFSLFLLIALTTFLEILLGPPQTEASALRLITHRSTSIAEEMPLAYLDKIKRIPHVQCVAPLQWFNGAYKELKNQFANFATDPVAFWELRPEIKVSDETKRRFASERMGCVPAENLMKRFGWKVDDRITLKGTIYPVDLEFVIVGDYYDPNDRNSFFFRHDYLNEALGKRNAVGSYYLRVDKPESVPAVADAVDGMFRNSPAETKTETEKAFILGFVSMLGNIRVLVGSIASVVIFTMLLVAASTMAMAIRERTGEIAILKAIGYPRRVILFLILGEALFIAMLGFGVGLVLIRILRSMDLVGVTQGFIQNFSPSWAIYAMTLLVAAGIGVFSGIVPAWRASSQTITGAMRQME
ncbi:MAG: ABC transporter permease [Candidatus Sumerlaeota bacterium]|nr:ABC transporter permease [Candidatus Sumerlaeota bacterium]